MKFRNFNINPRKLYRIRRRFRELPGGIRLFQYLSNKALFAYLAMIRSTRVAYPSSIVLEATNHCNLRCITCPLQYDSGQDLDKGSSHKEAVFRIIDEVAPYVDNIGMTGLGETLINKKLVEILMYIKSKGQGIQTSLSTNAHLPKSAQYLKRIIPYLDQLQISIDGIHEIYEEVRIDGNYSFFLENVREYKAICDSYNVPLLFSFTIIKENFHQMPLILDLAAELGIQYVNMNPMNVTAVSDKNKSYYDFYLSEEYLQVLKQTIVRSKELKSVELSMYDYSSKSGFKKCIYPWIHNYVTWDGYLVPCCARPFPKEKHFGNVFENGLIKSLNSAEFRKVRKMWFRNEAPSYCEDCNICDLEPVDIGLKVAHS